MLVERGRFVFEGLEDEVVGGRFGAEVASVEAERNGSVEDVGEGDETVGGVGKVEK